MANNIIINVEDYKRLLEAAIKEIDVYIEHPTKASSLRIRKHSTFIGKDGNHLRAALIANDKAN
jgi:hypothetical protein